MTATLSDPVCNILNEKCFSGKAAIIKSGVALTENIAKLDVKNVSQHELKKQALEVLDHWINEKNITRILVSCSASRKLAEELEIKVKERFGKGRKLKTFVVTSKTEEKHRQAAISKFQSDIDEEDKTIYVVFATEIFSSGVDCVVQAVLSVGGTYSVAECFQFLGRLGRRDGQMGLATILYTDSLWSQHQIEVDQSSDQKLFSELRDIFGEENLTSLQNIYGCISFRTLMHYVNNGQDFKMAIETLMNKGDARILKCKKSCSTCGGEQKKRHGPEIKDMRKGARFDKEETEEVPESIAQIEAERKAIDFYNNELKEKINASKSKCLLCKSEISDLAQHHPKNCASLTSLEIRIGKKCGYCLGDTYHKADDFVNCCLLKTESSSICVMCFREKSVCQGQTCKEYVAWKSTRLVMMAIFLKKQRLGELRKMFKRFDKVTTFKDLFKQCTDGYILDVNGNRYSQTILVLVFAYKAGLIS